MHLKQLVYGNAAVEDQKGQGGDNVPLNSIWENAAANEGRRQNEVYKHPRPSPEGSGVVPPHQDGGDSRSRQKNKRAVPSLL